MNVDSRSRFQSLSSVQRDVTIERKTVLDAYNSLEKLCDAYVNVSSVKSSDAALCCIVPKFTGMYRAYFTNSFLWTGREKSSNSFISPRSRITYNSLIMKLIFLSFVEKYSNGAF